MVAGDLDINRDKWDPTDRINLTIRVWLSYASRKSPAFFLLWSFWLSRGVDLVAAVSYMQTINHCLMYCFKCFRTYVYGN